MSVDLVFRLNLLLRFQFRMFLLSFVYVTRLARCDCGKS